MRILLIQPKSPMAGSTFPTNLASLDSWLISKGIDSELVNLNREELNLQDNPDIIGIGAYTICADEAKRLVGKFRKVYPKAKVLLGGRHFTYLPEEGKEADGVVIGDGEYILEDICFNRVTIDENKGQIFKGREFQDVENFYWQDETLDKLYLGEVGKNNLPIVGARGCVFNCVFCGEHSKKIRYQSPESFVELLERILKRFHNRIFIVDDIFAINKKRAEKICDIIIRKDLKLKMRIFGHINSFDVELYKHMQRAGVEEVCFGVESGNNEILKLIGKKFTIDKAYNVIQQVKKIGLRAHCLYMLGNIGETERTMQETIKFARNVKSHGKWFSHAVPLPGTEFYRVANKYGKVLNKPWGKFYNTEVCFVPFGLTEQRLIELRKEAFKG
jgi:radical SAM superfamily enzyme YgiQ (UPF0313 family)